MRVVEASDTAALSDLYRGGWHPPAEVSERVAEILAAVRKRGDAALLEYSRRYDHPGQDCSAIRVPIPMHAQAKDLVPHEIATALALARERVERFHRRQVPADIAYTEDDGTRYELRYRPFESIAAYVPGGTAALPSSVIMSVVPAKIAGVERIIVLTPPQRDGRVAAAVRFACWLCDVDELYAVGGAHAIAAAAYGTETIARVDKIVGPGNIWVTEAKRQIYGTCAIDGLAGPSEVLVVADDTANVEYVVGELLAQAEHDPMARVAVVSTSRPLLEACSQLLEAMALDDQDRGAILRSVFERGTFLVHAQSRGEVLEVSERFAPEHLSLQVADPEKYLGHLRRVGAVFVGVNSPVAAGDYVAGTNHVLPTSGAARFSSGLRTDDFLRSFSVVGYSPERILEDAPAIAALAEFEGLPQHARSALLRADAGA
jgi:histidinol dehydrogenase